MGSKCEGTNLPVYWRIECCYVSWGEIDAKEVSWVNVCHELVQCLCMDDPDVGCLTPAKVRANRETDSSYG